VSILTAVVTSLVSSGLGAIGRYVAHFSTIEAATVLGPGFVDDLAVVAFQTRVLTVSCDVTTLQSDAFDDAYAQVSPCISLSKYG
jgi:GTP:adenosylcobinamide-phosphate guanylyltransferase